MVGQPVHRPTYVVGNGDADQLVARGSHVPIRHVDHRLSGLGPLTGSMVDGWLP